MTKPAQDPHLAKPARPLPRYVLVPVLVLAALHILALGSPKPGLGAPLGAPIGAQREGAPALTARLDDAIPDGACFVERWYEDPKDDFLEPYQARTREALRSSGLDKALIRMVSALMDGGGRGNAGGLPEIRAAESAENLAPIVPIEGFFALVPSDNRFEAVLSGRVADSASARRALEEGLLMLRDRIGAELRTPDSANESANESAGESANVDMDGAAAGPATWILNLPGLRGSSLHASLDGHLLVVATSESRLCHARDRLAASGRTSRVEAAAAPSRIDAARRRVPSPGKSLRFIDWKTLLSGAERTLDRWIREASTADEGPRSGALPWLRIASDVVTDLAFLDTTIRVEGATPDGRLRRHCETSFDPSKLESPLARLFVDRPRFDAYHVFCPYETTNADLNPGIDPLAAFDYAVALIERHVPDGPELLEANLERLRDILSIDIRDDLFAPFTGQNAVFYRPGTGSKMFGTVSDDIVAMFRLRDPKALATLLQTWPDSALRRFAGPRGAYIQPVDPIEIFEGSIFYGWSIPIIGDFRPTYGVHGDWFVFGSRPAAIQRAIEGIESGEPTLLQNPRFSSIGLVPYTAVRSFQFLDMGWDFQNGALVLTQMGMTGTMVGMALRASPEGLENERMLTLLAAFLDLLPPTAKILQTLDYYGDRVAVRYHDRERNAIVGRTVTTIRPKEAATTEASRNR